MSFDKLVENAKQFFPDLQIKYKDESPFMKLLSKILFFNTSFMTSYTTTIGSTIYFPNKNFIEIRPMSSTIIFLHELVHIYDSKRFNKSIFSFLYLSPQILALLTFPLLFISLKFLPLLLLLAPIPSPGRMYLEKRAYFVSLYVMQQLATKFNYNSKLDRNKEYFSSQFDSGSYYWMWTFKGLKKDFKDAVEKILSGKKPYEDPVFNIIDQLLEMQ
jgi:hypothetical protein